MTITNSPDVERDAITVEDAIAEQDMLEGDDGGREDRRNAANADADAERPRTAGERLAEALDTPAPARSMARRTSSSSASSAPKPPTTKDAAEKVLREADGPMKVAAIAEQIIDRQLAPGLKGKTPAATIGAQIITESKKPAGRFVQVDRGTFDLRELNPKAAATRPAPAA